MYHNMEPEWYQLLSDQIMRSHDLIHLFYKSGTPYTSTCYYIAISARHRAWMGSDSDKRHSKTLICTNYICGPNPDECRKHIQDGDFTAMCHISPNKSSSQTKKKKLHKEEEKRMSEEIELQTLLTKLLIDDLERYILLNYCCPWGHIYFNRFCADIYTDATAIIVLWCALFNRWCNRSIVIVNFFTFTLEWFFFFPGKKLKNHRMMRWLKLTSITRI